MSTFLLAWNPNLFARGGLAEELAAVRVSGEGSDRWSTWSRQIRRGDRLFLIRLGDEVRGIVGSGWAVAPPIQAPHWDPDRAVAGDTDWYVRLVFDRLREAPIVSWQTLQNGPLAEFHWSIQRSGVRIPDHVATALEGAWLDSTGSRVSAFPTEVELPEEVKEGRRRRVVVNRYERDGAARAAAIAAHGLECSICNMTFLERYGPAAAGYIQVHHLVPMSARREEYVLRPVEDLRPVCPNCHSVIHLSEPPYTPEEVRKMMARQSSSAGR